MLLKNDKVVDQTLSYNELLRKVTDQGLLIDIQQAKSFENNGTLFDLPLPEGVEMTPHSFQLSLQLYSDDFEPANPIGSRRTIHKVTFFWILKNLPPWLTQQARAVKVAVVCNTLDLQRYGYMMILSRISKDLESLEEPFNVVTDEGTKITITGAQFTFVADRTEYHSALGFVKNFSKSFFERCQTTADDFSKHFDQSKCLLHSFKSFTKNVEKTLNRQPSKGVRAKSHLETKYFSAYRNWTDDIQHDLFEGGTQYTLKLVIHNLIVSRKIISIDILNYRLQSFAYGREIDGKPTEIDLNR